MDVSVPRQIEQVPAVLLHSGPVVPLKAQSMSEGWRRVSPAKSPVESWSVELGDEFVEELGRY